ncbi:MAG: citryl-CoA lyase [Proteobacteria bacterium]|nr:citryl-CoA lyase [Pseudomonadota bacterium]
MAEEKAVQLPEWSTAVSDVGFNKINIRGYPLVDLIKNASFSEVVYLTIRGELPSRNQARVMDAVLCGIVDHGFFTPTSVAARIIASATPESIIAGIAGGLLTVGSLTVSPQDTAELILGAYEVMKSQGLSIEETGKIVAREMVDQKQKVPGLGHPLHPNGDPRAAALKEVAKENDIWGEKAQLYEEIHRSFLKLIKKSLPINIDGMMGCVLTELGFQPKEMAGIAAMSFLPGIIAHTVEETQKLNLRVVFGTYTGAPERKLAVD